MRTKTFCIALAVWTTISGVAIAQTGGGTTGGSTTGTPGAAPGSAGTTPGTPGTTGPTNPGLPGQVTGNPAAPLPGQPSPLPPQMQTQGTTLPGGTSTGSGATMNSPTGVTRPDCNSAGTGGVTSGPTTTGGTPRIANDPAVNSGPDGRHSPIGCGTRERHSELLTGPTGLRCFALTMSLQMAET